MYIPMSFSDYREWCFEHSLPQLWIFLSANSAKNISLPWLSPFQENIYIIYILYIYMHINVYNLCEYIYIYIYIYIHTHIQVCIFMHTHIHLHISINQLFSLEPLVSNYHFLECKILSGCVIIVVKLMKILHSKYNIVTSC